MASPPPGSTLLIDAEAAELTILVERAPSKIGWEHLLVDLERYVSLVDVVILEGTAWGTPTGRQVELVLREALPTHGVPVVHADDPALERRRSLPRRRRGPGRRRRSPQAW